MNFFKLKNVWISWKAFIKVTILPNIPTTLYTSTVHHWCICLLQHIPTTLSYIQNTHSLTCKLWKSEVLQQKRNPPEESKFCPTKQSNKTGNWLLLLFVRIFMKKSGIMIRKCHMVLFHCWQENDTPNFLGSHIMLWTRDTWDIRKSRLEVWRIW